MKAGLLPLYIKLYDDAVPQLRPRLETFYDNVVNALEDRGIEVVTAPFCRVEPEFAQAVAAFEAAKADAIITLHMAYSPSLESIGPLTATDLPIIVLDTTETLEFTNTQNPDAINYNHGIHGVMDLCSMLLRSGKPFAIAAGHYADSPCLDRAVGYLRAAVAARALKNARVGLFAGSFPGMGDFSVPAQELTHRFGIQVQQMSASAVAETYDAVTKEALAAERAENEAMFTLCTDTDSPDYAVALQANLALRRCIEKEHLTAFSVTFLNIGRQLSGLPTMPFTECCKAMARGIGYAGEGDALTAAFIGALLQGWQETNFVEIFCPDWKNGVLFLSHMGELNYRIADCRPALHQAAIRYAGEYNPYAAYARMKGGPGVYLNVCRGKDDFKLVLAECSMLSYNEDTLPQSMRGWMQPSCGTAAFLEALSRNGATHHSAFVYGATAEQLRFFGEILGLETIIL